jgi:signal recognition particle subunit SRP54
MFDSLTEKLTGVFSRLGSKGRLTEEDVDAALREVRLALLEADVNFKVAREFVAAVRERAIGEGVLRGISPGQQVVKIVHDQLVALLGEGDNSLKRRALPPSVILLVGLQGSGKTTTAAKLALHLRRQQQRALLIAADLRRPAAMDQLEALGRQLDIPVHREKAGPDDAPKVAANGLRKAREMGVGWAIVDTGGRLHVDEELMAELAEVRKKVEPDEVLLVVDAMTGQDAVNAATEFNERVGLTGLVLTKLDGDSRGGAALSARHVSGVPIKFVGTGEKSDALEPFHPDRMASRILGMGDVVSLVEKVQAEVTEEEAAELERKMRRNQFDLEDFRKQLRQLQRLGSLTSVLDMLPGGGALKNKLPTGALDERKPARPT